MINIFPGDILSHIQVVEHSIKADGTFRVIRLAGCQFQPTFSINLCSIPLFKEV